MSQEAKSLNESKDKQMKPDTEKDTEPSMEPLMGDNEAAALLASLMHIKHKSKVTENPAITNASSRPITFDSHKETTDNTTDGTTSSNINHAKHGRKRSRSEMESESMETNTSTNDTSISSSADLLTIKSKNNSNEIITAPVSSPSDPLQNIDWNTTQFMFIRLTYFNKRKCRRFPLQIDDYSLFTSFVEYYFQSLTNCNWHTECDENWIECLDDLHAVRDEFISMHGSRAFFLELMIINDSLGMKRIYAPKAVYVDNPYKCKYPPIEMKSPKASPAIQPKAAPKPTFHPPPAVPYPPTQPQMPYYPTAVAPAHPVAPPPHVPYVAPVVQQTMPPMQQPMRAAMDQNGDNGYHHVTYPHYLSARSASSSSLRSESSRMNTRNGHKRSSVIAGGAICPDPTTYLPFAHAGQSTPQMRTLHKIVWVLQHQTKPLTIDAIRQCLPGKKKAQVNEIDYLLSSYQSHRFTKCTMVNSRKVWTLLPGAFPNEFWNRQWQRTN